MNSNTSTNSENPQAVNNDPSEPSNSTAPLPGEGDPQAQNDPNNAAVAAANPTNFRFDDPTLPAWMQGKTPAEVAQMTTSLYNAVQQGNQFGAASAPQAQPQQPPSSPQPAASDPTMNAPNASLQPQPPDPDLMYSDPAAYQRQYDAYARAATQAQMQQYAMPLLTQNAETARELSRMGAHKDIWTRWEPEIETMLAGIPAHQRSKALYDQAAAIVKSNHVDELAQERAEQLAASGNFGTERAGSAGNPAPSSSLDALDEAWDSGHVFFEGAKQDGLTKDQIRSFVAASGQTIDEYVKNATLGNLIPTKHGLTRSS